MEERVGFKHRPYHRKHRPQHHPLNRKPSNLRRSECLKDTVERCLPYWHGAIVPALKRGKTVLVAAHGNSIRGIVKYLDGISDADITELEIPTGIPLVYRLNKVPRPEALSAHPRESRPSEGVALVALSPKPRVALCDDMGGSPRPTFAHHGPRRT